MDGKIVMDYMTSDERVRYDCLKLATDTIVTEFVTEEETAEILKRASAFYWYVINYDENA